MGKYSSPYSRYDGWRYISTFHSVGKFMTFHVKDSVANKTALHWRGTISQPSRNWASFQVYFMITRSHHDITRFDRSFQTKSIAPSGCHISRIRYSIVPGITSLWQSTEISKTLRKHGTADPAKGDITSTVAKTELSSIHHYNRKAKL